VKSEIYWIESDHPGRLAILARPRGGDWLEDEVQAWRDAGMSVAVSLLTLEEISELNLEQEARYCKAHGLEHVSFAIPDRDVPASREPMLQLARSLGEQIEAGQSVGIHCRQGIGRSAMLAASVLTTLGVDVGAAFDRIRSARGRPVPDTPEQRVWVERLAPELQETEARKQS
jgi:protein-tyrosine phosphatase